MGELSPYLSCFMACGESLEQDGDGEPEQDGDGKRELGSNFVRERQKITCCALLFFGTEARAAPHALPAPALGVCPGHNHGAIEPPAMAR